MLKRKLGLAVAAILCVGLMTSCIINDNRSGAGGGSSGNGIDYTDYTDFSIKVRNETDKNVVCFKGTPSDGTLISGARGNQTTGLRFDNTLFSKSGDFVLWVFTEDDYLQNKNDYNELKKNVFAMIYAYYNADSSTNANLVYTISKNTGGEAYIVLNNTTQYNVELRQMSPFGDSLAFAGAQTIQTKVHVAYNDYYIYPVFRKFSKSTGEIVSCFPKTADGDPVVKFFSVQPNLPTAEFQVQEWFDPNCVKDNALAASAYVTISNYNSSAVHFYKSAVSEAEVTSTGGKLMMPSHPLVFEIKLGDETTSTYTSTTIASGWRVGSPVAKFNQGYGIVPEQLLEAGKMYYIDVRGDEYYPTVEWRKVNGELVVDTVNFDEDETVQ